MPVYQYEGVHYDLPDGLSNEQAIAKIESHLGKTPVAKEEEPSFLDKAIGAGQAGASLLTGAVAMPVGFMAAGLQKLNNPSGVNFEEQTAANMNALTYEPSRELGTEYANKIGQVFNDVGIPAMAHIGMTRLPTMGEMGTQVRSKFKGSEIPSGTKSLVESLKAPEVPVEPSAPRSAIGDMAEQLGYKEGENSPLRNQTPTQDMAGQLSKMGEEQRTSTVQAALDEQARALQEEMNTRVTRDQTTAERQRQENAPVYSEEHNARVKAEQEAAQAQLDQVKAQLAKEQEAAKTAEDQARLAKAEEAVLERQKQLDNEVAQRTAEQQRAAELEQGRRQAANMDSAPSELHQRWKAEKAKFEEAKAAETQKQAALEKQRAEAVAETERINAAQAALDARQKALESSMAGVGDTVQRNMRLQALAEARTAMEAASPFSKKHNAFEAKRIALEEAAKKKADIAKRRAENEALIQKLRQDHEASLQRQAEAQAEINRRIEQQRIDTTTRTTLDLSAAERARQEAGTIPPAVGPLPLGSKARAANKGRGKKQMGGVLFDWGNKNKAPTFSNIPGLKESLRDIGNALIRTPEEAIKLAKEFGDVSEKAANSAINAFTKGGIYLKQKLNNPVVHFTVDRFLKATGEAAAEINQKLHNEYLGSLRKLSKEEYNDAFTLLNTADLTQKTITPEMMQQHGLSAKLQDFIMTHQKMMDDVLGKINAAREANGKKPITAREAYSAMSMAGDYRKVAYKTIDGVKTVVGVIGSDRKAGKLGWSLEKIEKHMLEKDPTLEFGPMQDTTARTGSMKGTPHEAFQDALATIGENNPHVQAFLDTLKEVAKDDPSNYMGMQQHTMQKKGVWGMEGRKPWMNERENATQFFENQTKYMESAYNWSHLSEAARDVNTVLRDKDLVTKQERAIKISEEYMQKALGLNPSRVGRAVSEVANAIGDWTGIGPSNIGKGGRFVKSIANTWMLSANPSFLAIQMIQAPAAIPAMTALLRGRGLAPSSTWLSQGLGHFADAGVTLIKGKLDPQSLSKLDRAALEYAKDNHIYATDMVEHANQTTKGAEYYWKKGTQTPAALIEAGTRAQTYLGFVKMMDDAGLKPKDGLFEQAHRLTDQAMNNYGALEKPAIYDALGPIGSMAYNLKSFAHNEISRWSMLAREISATGNPAPLLTQMASTIVLAGVMGLPFYSQWEQLYDFITKKLGNPRSLTLDVVKASGDLAEKLGDKAGDFRFAMSHGAASYFGADISKRVGLGDVLPSKAADAAFAGGGKAWEMASSPVKFAMKPDEAHARSMAMAWAPPILAGLLKERWYTEGDKALSMNPDKPTTATATLNDRDKLLKTIGVTGINESFQKERNYQLSNLDKTAQDHRDSALVGITYDLAHGKPLDDGLVEKYFVRGEGDVKGFESAINAAIMKLNLDPNQLAMLQDSASKSVTRAMSLQRRMENQ